MNLACWDGRVSEHWQEEEHPLDDRSPTGMTPHILQQAPLAETTDTPPPSTSKEGQ
jgi:hypothetical protein